MASLGYEFAEDMLRYRSTKKYADSLKGILSAADGYNLIHPEVSMTKTNRISYSNPSLMNIPKDLLWSAIAPYNKGDILISADIKNQEPSIMINMNNVGYLKPALTSSKGLYEEIFSRIPIQCHLNIFIRESNKYGIHDNEELAKLPNAQPIYYQPRKCTMDCVKYNGETVELIEVTNFVVKPGEIPELPDRVTIQTDTGSTYSVPCKYTVDWDKPSNKKKLNSGGNIETDGVILGLDIECNGDVRKEFKVAWNAMTYGSSMIGIRERCKKIDGKLVYDYFTTIPGLSEYRSIISKMASQGKQRIRTYFGTILDANETNQKALKRILLDLPIQGTAADILSLLVKHFNEETAKMGIKDDLWIYYTRHDELIIEASKELVENWGIEKVLDTVKYLTEHQVDDWVPFKVDVEVVSKQNVESVISNSIEDDD